MLRGARWALHPQVGRQLSTSATARARSRARARGWDAQKALARFSRAIAGKHGEFTRDQVRTVLGATRLATEKEFAPRFATAVEAAVPTLAEDDIELLVCTRSLVLPPSTLAALLRAQQGSGPMSVDKARRLLTTIGRIGAGDAGGACAAALDSAAGAVVAVASEATLNELAVLFKHANVVGAGEVGRAVLAEASARLTQHPEDTAGLAAVLEALVATRHRNDAFMSAALSLRLPSGEACPAATARILRALGLYAPHGRAQRDFREASRPLATQLVNKMLGCTDAYQASQAIMSMARLGQTSKKVLTHLASLVVEGASTLPPGALVGVLQAHAALRHETVAVRALLAEAPRFSTPKHAAMVLHAMAHFNLREEAGARSILASNAAAQAREYDLRDAVDALWALAVLSHDDVHVFHALMKRLGALERQAPDRPWDSPIVSKLFHVSLFLSHERPEWDLYRWMPPSVDARIGHVPFSSRGEMSNVHKNVSAVLRRMGHEHEREAVLRGLRVDILLKKQGLVVEVDGPDHFYYATDGTEQRLGKSAAKLRLLRAMNWKAVSLSVRDIVPLKQDEVVELLLRKMPELAEGMNYKRLDNNAGNTSLDNSVPDNTSDASPDSVPDNTSDTSPDSVPDNTSDTSPDSVPDNTSHLA